MVRSTAKKIKVAWEVSSSGMRKRLTILHQ